MLQILDLGCGVGGPAREICRFSRAGITGVNNNAHQVERAQQLTSASGLHVAANCSFVEANFMELPFEDASYHHAYAIEATCHAPDATACYKEIARCMKPGGMFICYEWVRSAASVK
jgi:sterol 24-C-methyltransferase